MLIGLPLLLAAFLALYPATWAWFAGWIVGEHFKPIPEPDPMEPFARTPLLLSTRNLFFSLLIAALWTALEWVRGWLLTGFGWNALGVSLHEELALIQIVEFTGVGGLSFLLVLCNAIGVITILRLRAEIGRVRLRPHFDFSLTVALVVVVFSYGARVLLRENIRQKTEPDKDVTALRVATLQPNIPQKWKLESGHTEEIIERLRERHAIASLMSPHLVLWPEAVVPGGMFSDEETNKFVLEQAALVPALLLGTDDNDRGATGEDHNSAALLLSGEKAPQLYDKRHLVPFGEYLPLRWALGWIAGGLVPGDFKPGRAVGIFKLKEPALTLGPLVCFEDTLGELAREPVQHGAQLLVNLTNDGWFGRSCEPEQHFVNSIFRAMENRRPMFRCTNTGITAAVDAFGKAERWRGDEKKWTAPFQESCATGVVKVPTHGEITFYTRHGEIFSIGCAIISAATIFLRTLLLRRRNKAS
jgi:apolipoprotein N-acyltransferase